MFHFRSHFSTQFSFSYGPYVISGGFIIWKALMLLLRRIINQYLCSIAFIKGVKLSMIFHFLYRIKPLIPNQQLSWSPFFSSVRKVNVCKAKIDFFFRWMRVICLIICSLNEWLWVLFYIIPCILSIAYNKEKILNFHSFLRFRIKQVSQYTHLFPANSFPLYQTECKRERN